MVRSFDEIPTFLPTYGAVAVFLNNCYGNTSLISRCEYRMLGEGIMHLIHFPARLTE